MKTRWALVVVTSLALPAAAAAQGSASIETDRRERPDYERRVGDVAVTLTAIGNIVALDDGIIQVEVSGKRFQSRPDAETKFRADKKTPLAGRKDLRLEDFFVGAPVKLTFVAESGKLLEVRMRYEKPKSTAESAR